MSPFTLFIWGYILVSQKKALLKITESMWPLWKGRGVHVYTYNTGKSMFSRGINTHVAVEIGLCVTLQTGGVEYRTTEL